MNAEEANEIFEELKQLAEESDSEKVVGRVKQLQTSGIEINVIAEDDDPEFFNESSPYTEVTQRCRIEINGIEVYDWYVCYMGYYGGGGTGWWIDRNDSSLDFDIESLLDALDLMPERPDVPEPDSDDEDSDESKEDDE